MARNRKRAKERRARRPQTVSARTREQASERNAPPNPIEHAAPDAEIAEAAEIPADLRDGAELRDGELREGELLEDATYEEDEGYEEDGAGEEDGAREEDGSDPEAGPEVEEEDFEPDEAPDDLPEVRELAEASEHRVRTRNRLLTFLEGSWRELQRVQWPDRRQVMQATGVVIGFVIVAGLFLGAADYVATHLVSFIVNGHY